MKSHRPFVPALAGALVVFGVMAAPATAQLTGHVKSVDVDAKRLVVTETGTVTDVGVTVTDQTPITTMAGKDLEIKDLKQGDGVAIAHNGGVASKIVVNVKPQR
jgi:Cu/Ag efflux protein CusF